MNNRNVVHTYNGLSPALKGKEILTHATTRMNLKDVMLREIRQPKRATTVRFPTHEVVKFMEKGGRRLPGAGGSCYFTGTEPQSCKMYDG